MNYEVIAVSDGESTCEKFFSDDYIAKPFSMTEVLARIKANIRRTTQYASGTSMQQPVLIKGALTMDLNAYSVKKDGKEMYQRFAFRRGIQTKLMQISRKLEEILKSDSDEKVMVFPDEPVLMELIGEINRLLLDRQINLDGKNRTYKKIRKIPAGIREEILDKNNMVHYTEHSSY